MKATLPAAPTITVNPSPDGLGLGMGSLPGLSGEDTCPQVHLRIGPDWCRLHSLQVPAPFRRRGYARQLMGAALNCADELGRPTYLEAISFEDRPLDAGQLRRFYESFGFTAVPGHPYAMVRQPAE